MKKLVIYLINIYQVASETTYRHCRFEPTCSEYAKQAITRFGVVKGAILATRRIFACHPFSKRPFYDPVPTDVRNTRHVRSGRLAKFNPGLS